jgi:hypothetical protein
VRVKITESSRGTLFGTVLEINPSSLAWSLPKKFNR